MTRALPLLLLVACVSPQAMEVDHPDAAGAAIGSPGMEELHPDGPLPSPEVEAGPRDAAQEEFVGVPSDAAAEGPLAPPCAVTWLCVLYVTASPPAEDFSAFCPHAMASEHTGLAWEATMDYVAFLAHARPVVCQGQPQFTPLTVEVWKYNADGSHGTKAVSSQACP